MKAIGIVVALAMTGCASTSGWTPTVDPAGDMNSMNITRDMSECSHLANQATGAIPYSAAKGALIGGAAGAAMGAAVGTAVGGQTILGAMVGAAAGGIGGGTYEAAGHNAEFKRAYSTCMRGRGHRPLN